MAQEIDEEEYSLTRSVKSDFDSVGALVEVDRGRRVKKIMEEMKVEAKELLLLETKVDWKSEVKDGDSKEILKVENKGGAVPGDHERKIMGSI